MCCFSLAYSSIAAQFRYSSEQKRYNNDKRESERKQKRGAERLLWREAKHSLELFRNTVVLPYVVVVYVAFAAAAAHVEKKKSM